MEGAGEQITLRPVRGTGPLSKEHGVWVFRAGQPLLASATDDMLQHIREDRDVANLGMPNEGIFRYVRVGASVLWRSRAPSGQYESVHPIRQIDGCRGAHSLAEVYSTLTRMPGKHRISGEQAMLFIGSIRERAHWKHRPLWASWAATFMTPCLRIVPLKPKRSRFIAGTAGTIRSAGRRWSDGCERPEWPHPNYF